MQIAAEVFKIATSVPVLCYPKAGCRLFETINILKRQETAPAVRWNTSPLLCHACHA
jgi:hypothetical protein